MEGQALVARLKKENPNASVFEILEMTRKIHIQRAAESIERGNYGSPVHIIEDLTRTGSTCEDIIEIFSILKLNYWTPKAIQSLHEYFRLNNQSNLRCHCWSFLLKLLRTSNTKRTHLP
jgi:hypothetical protein